ncbi:MAG: hypothetical protein MI702_13475, partial [Chlorobiales bacterium]|nr:hypothetical protein [Chlorobiales bacterium]
MLSVKDLREHQQRKGVRMKAKIARAIGITLILVAMTGAQAWADTITWRMPTSWPKGTILQWAADFFAETVTAMSKGRLTVKAFPAGAIMGPLEVYDATESGAVQAAHSSAAYFAGKNESAALFTTVPAGLDPIANLAWYYESDGLKLLNEMYADFGNVMPCGIIPADQFAWSHKPITNLKDF